MAVRQVLSRTLATCGLSLRHVSLIVLVMQNSVSILVMHHSRVASSSGGNRYLASTAVLLAEVLKLVASFVISWYSAWHQHTAISPWQHLAPLLKTTCSNESWKLAVPALLYTLQTSLLYIATSNLEAATFQVTYQLKILTTVLFSVALLGRKLSTKQWWSLLLLTVGIATVQLPSDFSLQSVQDILASPRLEARHPAAYSPHKPGMNALRGSAAVVGASLTSGLVGVYLEKVVKDSLDTVSLWTRNVQLSFFSIFPALFIGVLWQDGHRIAEKGFFNGYNGLVWTNIIIQAFGGIMVAVCITYTDNIAKNFATSISIVVSTLAGALIFHYIPTRAFVVGTTMVMLAIYLYSGHGRPSVSALPLYSRQASYMKLKQEAAHVHVKESGGDYDFDSGVSDLEDYPMTPIRKLG